MIIGELNLKKIGDRLRKVDRYLLDVLSVRLAHGGLSDSVAENKRKGEDSKDGIYSKRRQDVENNRIELMKKWARESDIDPNFAAAIMYQLISESCLVQDKLMVEKFMSRAEKVDESDPEAVYAFQRKELLRLTSVVAGSYDEDYAQGFFASKLYFGFESQMLAKLISTIKNNDLAIDLGCATGIISFSLASSFKKVIGYDISPDMINEAKDKITKETSHVEFVNIDVEEGIDLSENSVSLAVMNMGTASDIKNIEKVFKCLSRCLKPEGKFFLSFYNSESLLAKMGFIPWPTPLAAHIDSDRRCLEVHYGKDIYFLYARPRSVQEVEELLSGFKIENRYTFPTLAAVMPMVILENEDSNGERRRNKDARRLIKKIDNILSESDLCSGTYIIVTGGKLAK